MLLHSKGRTLGLSRPQVMGILNVTPDSFSDGSRYQQLDVALRHASAALEHGRAQLTLAGAGELLAEDLRQAQQNGAASNTQRRRDAQARNLLF